MARYHGEQSRRGRKNALRAANRFVQRLLGADPVQDYVSVIQWRLHTAQSRSPVYALGR
jgi:hypothetical protein